MTALYKFGPGRRNGRNGPIAVTAVPTPVQRLVHPPRQHLIIFIIIYYILYIYIYIHIHIHIYIHIHVHTDTYAYM